jgi:hypothetical protein
MVRSPAGPRPPRAQESISAEILQSEGRLWPPPAGRAGRHGSIPGWAGPALAALAITLLYLREANPAVGGGNSGEFQVMAHLLGIAHPPSYPLYLLLAKLASLVPLPGDVAWRINLFTALTAGLAVWLSARLALELWPQGHQERAERDRSAAVAGRSPAVALLGAVLAAVAVGAMPRLWSLAVEAEVFALHLALVLGFWIAVARWQRAGPGGGHGWLLGAALLTGLGLANHRTFLFVAAGGLLTVLLTRPRELLHPKLVAGAAFLFALGLTPYLYVLRGLRWPVAYFAPTDVRRLSRGEVWYVLQGNASGETGGGEIVVRLLADGSQLVDRSRWLWHHLSAQFGLAGTAVAVLALAGLLALARHRPAWLAGASLGALGAALFAMAYGKYPDADRYLLPLQTLLALGLGSALAGAAGILDRALHALPAARRAAGASLGLLLGAYWVFNLGTLAGTTDFTRGGYVHHTLHNLTAVERQAVVCSWWASAWGWWYAQYVDGVRRDVRVVPKGPDECLRDVVAAELGIHPVYLPAITERVRQSPYAFFPSRDLWLAVGHKPTLVDGALLKGPDDRIYLFQDGQRHWVPSMARFTARGFSWEAVRLTPPYVLETIPEGPPLE